MMQDNTARTIDTSYQPGFPRPSVHTVRDQVRELAPGLDAGTPAFGAAVLLLSALQVGQNIDRLTRFTGLERSFVAKCARRLVDNGVWRSGKTVCEWYRDGTTRHAFWNDVAVAEGKMCRRIDEAGAIEWAAAGAWFKNYDFISPEANAKPDNSYITAPAPTPSDHPSAPDGESTSRSQHDAGDKTAGTTRRRKYIRRERSLPSRARVPVRDRPKMFRSKPDRAAESRAADAPPRDLFPDAQWLG